MSKSKKSMSNRHGSLQTLCHDAVPELEILQCAECQLNYWRYPDSQFRHWCFYWNASAGAVISSGGRRFELTPEQAVLIPPFTNFSTDMYAPFRHFYIHFTGNGILEAVRPGIITLPGEFAGKAVADILQSKPFRTSVAIHALLYQAVLHIPSELFDGTDGFAVDQRVRRIIDMMYEDPGDFPGNRQLCRMIGMNINEFYDIFKKATGLSPRQYLLMLRMEQASQFLRHGKLSIDEIAGKCGFADRYHFSKSFRKHFGLPPAEFRMRHNNQA